MRRRWGKGLGKSRTFTHSHAHTCSRREKHCGHTHVDTHIHAQTQKHTDARALTDIYTHADTRTPVFKHTYTLTDTSTHTHTGACTYRHGYAPLTHSRHLPHSPLQAAPASVSLPLPCRSLSPRGQPSAGTCAHDRENEWLGQGGDRWGGMQAGLQGKLGPPSPTQTVLGVGSIKGAGSPPHGAARAQLG